MARTRLALGEHGEVEAFPMHQVDGKWKRAVSNRNAQQWRARVYYRGQDGVRSEISARSRTRKAAVARVKENLSARLSMGDPALTPSTPLVTVGEQWLTQIRRTDSGLSELTVKVYEQTFHRYVDAQGSSLRGLTITQANNVQRIRTFLQGVADNNGSGSARTSKTVLSNIFTFALESDVVALNAARQLRPPKANAPSESKRDRKRSLTREEREQVLAYADKLANEEGLDPRTLRKRQALSDLLAVMAGTGARIGEARSIRWEHISLEHRFVRLHGTKSKAARRRLDLPEWLAERLHARIDQMAGHYRHAAQYAKHNDDETRAEAVTRLMQAADRAGSTGYVFPAPAQLDPEKAWDQSNSANAVRRVLDEAGQDWAVGHTFRRTVATWLGEEGVPLARIADQLGHEDPAMTASVYLGRDFEGDKSALAVHL